MKNYIWFFIFNYIINFIKIFYIYVVLFDLFFQIQ